jgi:hypothetical protein
LASLSWIAIPQDPYQCCLLPYWQGLLYGLFNPQPEIEETKLSGKHVKIILLYTQQRIELNYYLNQPPLLSQHDKIEQAPQLQGVLALLNLYLYHHIPKHTPLLQGDIPDVNM